jgi:hypothetical protein
MPFYTQKTPFSYEKNIFSQKAPFSYEKIIFSSKKAPFSYEKTLFFSKKPFSYEKSIFFYEPGSLKAANSRVRCAKRQNPEKTSILG